MQLISQIISGFFWVLKSKPRPVEGAKPRIEFDEEAPKASNSIIAQQPNLKVEDALLGQISTARKKKTKKERAHATDSKSEGTDT